jgi:uncharacterized protein (DUF924 family)
MLACWLQAITREFGADCEKLAKGEYDAVAEGDNVYDTIAMIIIGDQFRRNMFRNTPGMNFSFVWLRDFLSLFEMIPSEPKKINTAALAL